MKTCDSRVAGFTLVEIMVVVVIVGLLASLAVPTFVKIRATSQDKAVLNNLRQLVYAAEQYYLESGNTTVATVDLVGTGSTNYIKEVQTIANETYSSFMTHASPITAFGVGLERTINYSN